MPIAKDAPTAHGILFDMPVWVRDPERHRRITWGEFVTENVALGADRLDLIAAVLFEGRAFKGYAGGPSLVQIDIDGDVPLAELPGEKVDRIIALYRWWGEAQVAASDALERLGTAMAADTARH